MPQIKIATWNVNSLRVRLPHVIDWIGRHRPDYLALQEIKATEDQCPHEELTALGYHCVWLGQKTYNGVALLTTHPIFSCEKNIPSYPDEQKRVISIRTQHGFFINVYCPNGKVMGSESFVYKMQWYAHLKNHLQQILKNDPELCVVVCGDFNIAPEPIDIDDNDQFEKSILATPEERQCFQEILSLGFFDCFRIKEKEEGHYTWWDYRHASFRRGKGARIDHILTNAPPDRLIRCCIDQSERKKERPSDHAPVLAELLLELVP